MDLNQLRSFVAVSECGNLTRAAEGLHLSQPAVSAQIKALEEDLGQRLFHRSSAGMELSQAGQRMLAFAERVLSAAEDLKHAARAMTGEIAGKLRIGTLSDPQFIRLGEFLGRTLERFPLLELELQNEITGTALAHVRDGTLDASYFFGDIPDAGISSLPLGEIVYRIAAPAKWSERIRAAGWNAIAAMPWILPPESSTITQRIRALFREHGAELTTHIEADDEDVIVNLIESGVGVSLMREELAMEKERSGNVSIWQPTRIVAELRFICLADREHDPAIGALFEVLRETWAVARPPTVGRAAPPPILAVRKPKAELTLT